jgi:lipopolysaccharide transport system permease protein
MYSYVTQFRTIVLNGSMPEPKLIIYGIGVAISVLIFGTWSFYKSQDKFILYI